MRLLTFVIAAALAGLFVVSGTEKLRDLPGTARSFRALGLPAPYPLARAVALVELADALLLLVLPGVGGFIAVIALLAFTAVLVDGLHRGIDGSCGCFGRRSTGPISGGDVVRNVILVMLAASVVAVWRTDPLWA